MVKIIIEKGCGSRIAGGGVVMEQIAELGVGVELFVKELAKDCPPECKERLSELIQETLIYAVDKAIK